MPTTTTYKPRASLGTKRDDSPGVIERGGIMYAAILLAIASFPDLPVTMTAFKALLDALTVAQGATRTRTKGLATARNTKREALWGAMVLLRAYVQTLGDQLSVESSKALIESAGLLVGAAAHHVKPLLEVKPTSVPGTVALFANAALLRGRTSKRTTFHWQWSANGKDWVSATSTPHARTVISGLAVPGAYAFRVAVTVGGEMRDWTAPVSVQLH